MANADPTPRIALSVGPSVRSFVTKFDHIFNGRSSSSRWRVPTSAAAPRSRHCSLNLVSARTQSSRDENTDVLCALPRAGLSRAHRRAQFKAELLGRERREQGAPCAQSSCAPAASTAALLSSELHKYDWPAAAPSTKYEWLL